MPATTTYKPSTGAGYVFNDITTPVATKAVWGMDSLTRKVQGAQPEEVAYINALAQGQTTTFNGQTWYLQNWDSDHDPIFPTITLNYLGLNDGIPSPFTSGTTVVQTGTISCTTPSKASRTFSYYTRQSTYKYIKASRPTTPTYTTLDIAYTPTIFKSEIRNEDGTVYLGNAPAGLVTALTPVGVVLTTTMTATPVFGTPYFECEDNVVSLLPSN
jgi:hypothetical protein